MRRHRKEDYHLYLDLRDGEVAALHPDFNHMALDGEHFICVDSLLDGTHEEIKMFQMLYPSPNVGSLESQIYNWMRFDKTYHSSLFYWISIDGEIR